MKELRGLTKSIFFTVMEAEGDELQPFDGGNDDAPTADVPSEDIAPPATDSTDGGASDPPPLSDDGGGDFDMPSFGEDDAGAGGEDTTGGDTSNNEEEADKQDTSLSDKANKILNEQLYKKMVARNNEIDEILTTLKTIVPSLPYDVVNDNNDTINQLKNALNKGKNYVINDFVDSGYGENQLFFQELDSLYTLLLDQIDKKLKKAIKQ